MKITPMSLRDFYKQHGHDLTCDQLLEMIKQLGPGITVGKVINIALAEDISSPATTFKKLKELESAELIKSEIPPNDTRCRQLAITEKGLSRLKEWGK